MPWCADHRSFPCNPAFLLINRAWTCPPHSVLKCLCKEKGLVGPHRCQGLVVLGFKKKNQTVQAERNTISRRATELKSPFPAPRSRTTSFLWLPFQGERSPFAAGPQRGKLRRQSRARPEEEQGGCGIWQRSIHMVKAAPEIRALWLLLSQNNGEAFFWFLLPSPSTAAGERPPVLQARVQRDTAWLWWAQAELDHHPPSISWFL